MNYLIFDIDSYWHAGSGRGEARVCDAVVVRSRGGLPYLPGRTVKGLVREACELGTAAGMLTRQEVLEWFGSPVAEARPDDREQKLEEGRFRTEPGRLHFESATLGDNWEAWALAARRGRGSPDARISTLFRTVASTALEEGVARDQSLRIIEVAVPMVLRAGVTGLAAAELTRLAAVLPFIRGLGSHRNRGLGRVTVTLET